MSIKRMLPRVRGSVCITAAAIVLMGCGSTPKPAVPDGSSRVPVNEAGRLELHQQKVVADRALLTENNLLRAQVDALTAKLTEMTSIVREALTLPPAPVRQIAPASPAPLQPMTQLGPRRSMPAEAFPPHVYSASPYGIVMRVFHPFARTDFAPNDQVAQALRSSVRGAERIEVRGYTDSNVINPADRTIASQRAERARTWLINNGADASTIQTQYFTAGNFLSDNTTADGRALNRRVEIDIRNPQLAAGAVLSTN